MSHAHSTYSDAHRQPWPWRCRPPHSRPSESGDAGELPATAQDLSSAPVDGDRRQLRDGRRPDLYRVCLEGGGSFSATHRRRHRSSTRSSSSSTRTGTASTGTTTPQATRQSTLPAARPAHAGRAGRVPARPSRPTTATRRRRRRDLPAAAACSRRRSRDRAAGRLDRPAGLPRHLPNRADRDRRLRAAGRDAAHHRPPVPADGAQVPRGAAVAVDFSCADEGGSGLASCEGSVADGAALDTATLGPRGHGHGARQRGQRDRGDPHRHVVDATPPGRSPSLTRSTAPSTCSGRR